MTYFTNPIRKVFLGGKKITAEHNQLLALWESDWLSWVLLPLHHYSLLINSPSCQSRSVQNNT